MSESHLFNTSLEDWVHHELVSLPPTASITEVAQQMSQKNVSSVLLIDPTSHQLAGIVTDRDLRNRVLAVGKSPLAPALDIATTERGSLKKHIGPCERFTFKKSRRHLLTNPLLSLH